MSNTERQRLFRERNPGYYGRLHAKRRARIEAMLAAESALAAQATAVAARQRLVLPAPAERIEVPTMNTISRDLSAAVAAVAALPVTGNDRDAGW